MKLIAWWLGFLIQKKFRTNLFSLEIVDFPRQKKLHVIETRLRFGKLMYKSIFQCATRLCFTILNTPALVP